MAYEEPPEPTEEDINAAMRSVMAQFGEKFEPVYSKESEDEIIKRCEKEGWILVDIATNAAKMDVRESKEKEIKIVGRGARFLIFERPKNDPR